jgi:hypothetical protein
MSYNADVGHADIFVRWYTHLCHNNLKICWISSFSALAICMIPYVRMHAHLHVSSSAREILTNRNFLFYCIKFFCFALLCFALLCFVCSVLFEYYSLIFFRLFRLFVLSCLVLMRCFVMLCYVMLYHVLFVLFWCVLTRCVCFDMLFCFIVLMCVVMCCHVLSCVVMCKCVLWIDADVVKMILKSFSIVTQLSNWAVAKTNHA